jgi:hypothetical protein
LLPFLALLAVGLLAGGLAAALLTDGGGGRTAAEVRTVTRQGSTQRVTVTSPPPRTASPSGPGGAALAAAGYRKMKAGDYRRALPLLEQAAQKLHGSNSIGEAYNDYNLAFTLAKTSGCSGRVLQLLDRSQAIQGHRTEIEGLRRSCGG